MHVMFIVIHYIFHNLMPSYYTVSVFISEPNMIVNDKK